MKKIRMELKWMKIIYSLSVIFSHFIDIENHLLISISSWIICWLKYFSHLSQAFLLIKLSCNSSISILHHILLQYDSFSRVLNLSLDQMSSFLRSGIHKKFFWWFYFENLHLTFLDKLMLIVRISKNKAIEFRRNLIRSLT